MPYFFFSTIKLCPKVPVKKSYRKGLQEIADSVCKIFEPMGVESKISHFYFHPDEESEMRGFEIEGIEILLSLECQRFRSVAALSQISLSVASLFQSDELQCHCVISEPVIS